MDTDIDLYDVLGLENGCDKTEIKSAYKELVKKHHPDKGGDAEMFELITHAFNVLINDETRDEYNELTNLEKQTNNDHMSLANSAKAFLDSQNAGLTEEELLAKKAEASLNFNKISQEMDAKHNFNRSDQDAIDEDDAKRMADDMKLARQNEKDELEMEQDNLFKGQNFDLAKFNEMFDKMHKSDHEMILHDGNPGAWNTTDDDMNFTSYNTNYGDVYDDNSTMSMTSAYSGINVDSRAKGKLSKHDIKNIKGASYVTGHNVVDDDYNKSLEERMREYKEDLKSYDDRHFNDFDKNIDEFGVFNNLGIENAVVGFDWGQDEKQMKKAHQKLLESRKTKSKKDDVLMPTQTHIKEDLDFKP